MKQPAIDWKIALAQHQRWLRTVIFARVRETQAIDEVLQEVALAAVKQQAPLADAAKIAPWLYRLAVLSTHEYGMQQIFGQPAPWVGLQNFREILNERYFWTVLWRTLMGMRGQGNGMARMSSRFDCRGPRGGRTGGNHEARRHTRAL